MALAATPRTIEFGREVCGQLEVAAQREWLITNGLGGFASGTVAGLLTRRYHGLLVAALKPPLGRTLLVSKFDEIARYDGQSYSLGCNRWLSGIVDPQGFHHIESFGLEGTTPVWTFACADALVEKRVWMQRGANTTYVRYALVRGGGPIVLELKALVNYRDFHFATHAGSMPMEVSEVEHGLRIAAFAGATPFYLLNAAAPGQSPASVESAHEWCLNYDLARERERGLEDHEDHLHAGTFRALLEPGEVVTLVCTTEPSAELYGRAAWQRRFAHEQALLEKWFHAHSREKDPRVGSEAPGWVRQLVLAADQFIVQRPLPDSPDARSVIAGYHWFGDWGRDTMIALPGLTLSTGRPEIARSILRAYAHFVSGGMLPNTFPEGGETPEYNSVDAALWFFQAVRQCYGATRDAVLLRELLPVLAEILDWHVGGTRHHIQMDPADGLLAAGEPGVQLTWMDARVGDRVISPRIGKPVEINALWYNALLAMAQFARALERPPAAYEQMAARVRANFRKFWNDGAGFCFDVIDGPQGNDAALRPNQIFAVSLPESPLEPAQQRAVVQICARRLLTSHGLHSLAAGEPGYAGQYAGPPAERDAAYHQGTVWGWLLGPFVLAHLRVYRDPARAAAFLEPLARQISANGLGTLGEIFDGDAPFTPRGCIAQAWTVAEVLRAWHACQQQRPA